MSNGEKQAAPVAAALPASNEPHPAWKRVVLYTDTVSGIQTCRDDLFAITTDELKALLATPALPAEKVQGLTEDALRKAMSKAFGYGQNYWQQADSDFESQNKKADITRDKFRQLTENICDLLAASGGVPAPVDEYEGKFGYAEEGAENYNGIFDSEDDARAEAEAELSPGTTYAVGECTHPIEMIRGRAKHIGDDIIERVDEQTYDEVGGDEPAVDLNDEDKKRLGLLVLDFIKREGSTNRWGVKNIKSYTVPDAAPATQGEPNE